MTQFSELGLAEPILKAVLEQGYTTPTPVQEQAIPAVLAGRDVMAAAQTGTGKTAGFTLPILHKLQQGKRASANRCRALILTPTRELAAQVGANVVEYSEHLNMSSAVVFGGVGINPQMIKLRRGVDVLVACPGRLLDLYKQNAIRFDEVEFLVLDEADRMLDMGFIHDIKRILAMLPKKRQTLMFSATFSNEIRTLAKGLVHDPIEIDVSPRNSTAHSVEQWLIPVDKRRKPEVLSTLLKENDWNQVLVFTRTKHGANRLTTHLQDRGISAAAIHGNKSQGARTRALADFKNGEVTVLVATDIAARGLDIEQLPLVVNFELPNVAADYVHRIGRTGRAGRSGETIVFVRSREKRMLRDIERATRQSIEEMQLPTAAQVNEKRKERFQGRIIDALHSEKNNTYREMVEQILASQPVDALDVAAALASLLQGKKPLFIDEKQDARMQQQAREGGRRERNERGDRNERGNDRKRGERNERGADRGPKAAPSSKPKPLKSHPDVDMIRFVVGVGYDDGLRPGNLVGAIANEADLDSSYIGHIEILDNYAVVDLPEGMPKPVMQKLQKTRVCGRPLDIRTYNESEAGTRPAKSRSRGKTDQPRTPRAPRKPKE